MSNVNVWDRLNDSQWSGNSSDPMFALSGSGWNSHRSESNSFGTAAFGFRNDANQRELRIVD